MTDDQAHLGEVADIMSIKCVMPGVGATSVECSTCSCDGSSDEQDLLQCNQCAAWAQEEGGEFYTQWTPKERGEHEEDGDD